MLHGPLLKRQRPRSRWHAEPVTILFQNDLDLSGTPRDTPPFVPWGVFCLPPLDAAVFLTPPSLSYSGREGVPSRRIPSVSRYKCRRVPRNGQTLFEVSVSAFARLLRRRADRVAYDGRGG